VSVRLITATNQNLLAMVREGRFQADLYRCLSAIPITLPPLRERLEDIPEFVRFFIVKTAKKLGKKVSSATSKVLECLQMHFWPGNIRELENVIERVVAVAEGEFLIEEDLPIELRFLNSQSESGRVEYEEVLKRALAAFEKRFILQALDRNSWRLNKTADLMGIHRKTLEYKIKKLNLQEIIEAKRILKRQES
jgi:transcriptional regulator with PAS, ATPase and Fis domain